MEIKEKLDDDNDGNESIRNKQTNKKTNKQDYFLYDFLKLGFTTFKAD